MSTTEDRAVRLPEVRTMTGLSTSTIYAMSSAGTFPKQIRIGVRAVAWRASEVQAWLATRVAKAAV